MSDDKLTLRVQGLVLLGRIAHYTITCRDGQFGAAIESRQAETPGVNTASVWRYYETLDELLDAIGRNVARWDASSYLPGQEARPERVGAFLRGGVPWDVEATATPLEDFKAIPRPLGDLLGRKGLFGLDHIPALGAQASRAADALYEGDYPADMPPEAVERIRSILSGSVELPTGSGLPGAPIPADPEPQSPDSRPSEPAHELFGAPDSPEPTPEPCEPSEPQSPDLAGASPEPPIRSPELAESSRGLDVEPCPRCGAQCDVEPTTAQIWCHEWCGYSYLVANIRPVDVRPLDARQPATFDAVLEAHNRDCRDLRAVRMLRAMYDEGYGAELISFAPAGWTATKKSRVVPLFSVDADDPAEAILGLEEKPDA